MNNDVEESADLPGSGEAARELSRLERENAALRDRLAGLSAASLRISESLELDSVLQEIADGARQLTGAAHGTVVTFDESGGPRDVVVSGIPSPILRRLSEAPQRARLLEYLNGIQEPVRLRDFGSRARSAGFAEGFPPVKTFLAAPIRYRGEQVGNVYLGEKQGGGEFTPEDEETVVLFSAQAAMAITNAHRYRGEYRARADLEALVNTAPIGVVVLDAKTGNALSVNQETWRIFGDLSGHSRNVPQLLDEMTFQRMDGSEIAIDDLPSYRALRSGETVRAEEMVIGLPDGSSVTTVVNATPIRSADGEIVSVVATLQDMTPLEELERLRAEFLGMVSHELRTPLTTIKGSAATVLGASPEPGTAEMRRFFRIIDEQADHMRSLIIDLLDMTRIEAGILSVNPEPADVAALIEEARSAFLRGGARNTIEVDLPPDLPKIGADPQRVLQVLNNLFGNASRYSRPASSIRVAASVEDVYVAISVTNEGRGIPPEQLAHLFRKFSRADGADTARETAGVGLGLAICKGIVEAHGGRIRAESDGPDLGARFTFTIPGIDDAATRSASGARSARTGGRGGRILAVDDEPQILRYIRSILSEAGYTAIVTGDPGEVEHLMETETPDLVLLDLELPGINGIDLMKRILMISEVPVIFVSGYGGDEHVARAFETGADDYIVKPFSPTELGARIEAVLRRRASSGRTAGLEPYALGDLTINYAERLVTVAGRPVQLTATEYKLLSDLSVNAGRVLTHDQLLKRVWGPHYAGDSRLVRSFVKKLRRKLRDDASNPRYIFTEPRVGYRMAKS